MEKLKIVNNDNLFIKFYPETWAFNKQGNIIFNLKSAHFCARTSFCNLYFGLEGTPVDLLLYLN